MTDFSNLPPFEDPGYECPKCQRRSRYSARYHYYDATRPDTITWTHECGYQVVTLTAESAGVISRGSPPRPAPMPRIEIREADLIYEEWRTDARHDVLARVTHRPSGNWGEARDASPIRARLQARQNLSLSLFATDALAENTENRP